MSTRRRRVRATLHAKWPKKFESNRYVEVIPRGLKVFKTREDAGKTDEAAPCMVLELRRAATQIVDEVPAKRRLKWKLPAKCFGVAGLRRQTKAGTFEPYKHTVFLHGGAEWRDAVQHAIDGDTDSASTGGPSVEENHSSGTAAAFNVLRRPACEKILFQCTEYLKETPIGRDTVLHRQAVTMQRVRQLGHLFRVERQVRYWSMLFVCSMLENQLLSIAPVPAFSF